MTREELQTRIEKKEKDIAKIEKRIAKWSQGLNEEARRVASDYEMLYNDPRFDEIRIGCKAYRESHPEMSGWDFDELCQAYRDFAEAKETLRKYQVQIDAKKNFDNMEKIEVIWNFLQDWRASAREFFIQNTKEYHELFKNKKVEEEKYLNSLSDEIKEKMKKCYMERMYYMGEFEKNYYSNIHSFTKEIYLYQDKVDEAKLDKFLDKDVEMKYKNLVARITKEVGEIEDAKGLYIADNGEINGVVLGNNGKAKVETIKAGGYNIQVLHYRVLVHKVRG